MRTVIITQGLPASGKSTYARALLEREPDRWKRINRDDLRAMVGGTYSKANEDYVRQAKEQLLKTALESGYDVILDDTHLVPTTVKKLHRFAESIGDVKLIQKAFNVPVEECLRRNALRTGAARVPDKVIYGMALAAGLDKGRSLKDSETYYAPRDGFRSIDQDESLPRAIMCDLDGTLALMGDRSPYDASRCDEVDLPNKAVIACVLAMHAQDVKIVFMSGRDAKYREQTVRFIEKHCQFKDVVIPYELHMRPEGDQRKDSIVKRELFDAHVAGRYNVLFVLDDRNQVVLGWRQLGLTCFQVAEGNF